jgi:hypothetical protein
MARMVVSPVLHIVHSSASQRAVRCEMYHLCKANFQATGTEYGKDQKSIAIRSMILLSDAIVWLEITTDEFVERMIMLTVFNLRPSVNSKHERT